MNELRRRPRLLAVVLLVAVSAAWGSTFVVMKSAVTHTPVLEFLAWRFLLASTVLVALRPRAVLQLGRRGWAQGVGLGGVLAVGYIVQTYGLEHTSAAVSGFLTGMQVVFTPLLAWLLLRRRPGSRTWVATAVAAVGLAVITLRGLSFGPGETLTIMCAVLFALQIVGLGRWASVKDALGLATVQLLTVGIVCTLAQLPSGLGLPASGGEWWAVVVTAVAATAFAFAVQSWAQSHLSTTATSIVFTLEPVFAALFAWGAGEPIGSSVVVGGGLVVAAMLVLGLGPGSPPVAAAAIAPTAPCCTQDLGGFDDHRRWYERGVTTTRRRSHAPTCSHRTLARSDRLPPGRHDRLGGRRADGLRARPVTGDRATSLVQHGAHRSGGYRKSRSPRAGDR